MALFPLHTHTYVNTWIYIHFNTNNHIFNWNPFCVTILTSAPVNEEQENDDDDDDNELFQNNNSIVSFIICTCMFVCLWMNESIFIWPETIHHIVVFLVFSGKWKTKQSKQKLNFNTHKGHRLINRIFKPV